MGQNIDLPLTESMCQCLAGVQWELTAILSTVTVPPKAIVMLKVDDNIIFRTSLSLSPEQMVRVDRDAGIDFLVHQELLTYFVRYGASLMGLVGIEGVGSIKRWKVQDIIKAMIRFVYKRAKALGVEIWQKDDEEQEGRAHIVYEEDIIYYISPASAPQDYTPDPEEQKRQMDTIINPSKNGNDEPDNADDPDYGVRS